MTHSNPSPQQTPGAHEDLTIAELLEFHRIPDRDDGAMSSYRDSGGRVRRITKADVAKFLERFGPLHPGDYAEQEGCDWREDFYDLGRE